MNFILLKQIEKKFKPTDKTKLFIRHVKTLKETGEVKMYGEIIKAIDWDKTSFSNVIHGRANIPDYKFKEFVEVYGIPVEDPQSASIKVMLKIDAKCDVSLSALAELLAIQKGQTVEKIKTELLSMVNSRYKEKWDAL